MLFERIRINTEISLDKTNKCKNVPHCAANVLAGNIPINIAIKRPAEVRMALVDLQTKLKKLMEKV